MGCASSRNFDDYERRSQGRTRKSRDARRSSGTSRRRHSRGLGGIAVSAAGGGGGDGGGAAAVAKDWFVCCKLRL
jgi:hypothetical protein